MLPADLAQRLLADDDTPAGEVPWSECEHVFTEAYPALQAKAADQAQMVVRQIAERKHGHLDKFAKTLREEAALYKVDRLAEIDEQEREERAGSRVQAELFGDTKTNWIARRAAVETIHTQRLKEIEHMAEVPDIGEPQPLGALLVFPEN